MLIDVDFLVTSKGVAVNHDTLDKAERELKAKVNTRVTQNFDLYLASNALDKLQKMRSPLVGPLSHLSSHIKEELTIIAYDVLSQYKLDNPDARNFYIQNINYTMVTSIFGF